ncbi:Nn.00g094200.m01.CDS01 [Neocucurbitaria sp. VM-36]
MAKKAALKPKKLNLQESELFFRGGASVLKPNHITRYIYPSLCSYPKACLRLQPPTNSNKRSRPQGANSWGEDGHTFLTITRALKAAPTKVQFTQWSKVESAKDLQSKNPLGRAMARITKYAGNTVLESGKFAQKKGQPLVYVIKRTTVIPLGGSDEGKFGREEEEYRIECGKWRSMQPPTVKGHEHDSWWTRLHTLYQASYDRAFFHARENIDNTLNIPPPLIEWYPRPDIEAHVTLYGKPPPPKQAEFLGDGCFVCSRDWFTETEYACQLKCKHFVCLECLTWYIDGSGGRGTIHPNETDPNTKFFRCPLCKDINPITTDRTDITRPDELSWWRWKIMMRRMEREIKDNWLTRLQTLLHDTPPWFHEIPAEWDQDRQANDIKVYVRYDHAMRFMEVPKKIWSTLPYGFTLDNPVGSQEVLKLEECLKQELKRLSLDQNQTFNTKELVEHMVDVGRRAIRPVVVEDASARLGNPMFPPGYQAYRQFLSEWTARGCFLCPMGRMDLLGFMERMEEHKDRAWWKEERDVFFDP